MNGIQIFGRAFAGFHVLCCFGNRRVKTIAGYDNVGNTTKDKDPHSDEHSLTGFHYLLWKLETRKLEG